MNIFTKVTWRSMFQNKTRTLVTVIGIILSAAMFTAVVTLGISLWSFLVRGQIQNQGDYFIQYDYISDETVTKLSEDPDVTALADLQMLGVLKLSDGAELLMAAGDPAFYTSMPTWLLEGRLPVNSREILLPKASLKLMQTCGLETKIGETLIIRLDPQPFTQNPELLPGQMAEPYIASYTIVGYVDGNMYGDYELALDHMLTFADGDQADALWHRAFVKTEPRKIMELYKRDDGIVKELHDTLCGLYGVTRYDNVNRVLVGLVAVLCAIIMVGSVSLIYNAFSISVSERTKQFGLLSSIGATKRQIRHMVYTEALLLCALGIPLGVLSGYGGILVTLKLLSPRIDQMLSMAGGAVTLQAIFSPLGMLVSALIAVVTVLISAAIPAARTTGISPMEAIRQNRDCRQPKKAKKLGKGSLRLFGLPGALGKAYYTVSRGKYVTTVISLVISFVLFVSASSFSQTLQNTAQTNVTAQSFDISVRADMEDMDKLRSQSFVEKAAYERQDCYMVYTPDQRLSEEHLKYWPQISQYYSNESRNVFNIRIFYLEDQALEEYLLSHNIAPEPYFDENCPLALVCRKNFAVYGISDGEATRFTYSYDQFSKETERLQLFSEQIVEELQALPELQELPTERLAYTYECGPNGELLLVLSFFGLSEEPEQALTYQLTLDGSVPGKTQVICCPYDPDTQTAGPQVMTQTYEVPDFRLGAFIEDLPYGIPTGASEQYFYTSLILPLSQAPENIEDAILHISVSDYRSARDYVSRHFEKREYLDVRSSEEYNRTVLLVINVFSCGFIVLISLISIANVFNTISTNVALRRRDFGILRSIGFQEKDLMKMMHFECVNYGLRALAWSIPLSLPISYLIWGLEGNMQTAGYQPPWTALLIASLSIFLVVFAAMSYSASKVKKDNPIEAIRMES